jgi:predicted outer membrane lipoprotein
VCHPRARPDQAEKQLTDNDDTRHFGSAMELDTDGVDRDERMAAAAMVIEALWIEVLETSARHLERHLEPGPT